MIADGLFMETSRLHSGRLLLFNAQLSVIRRDGRDREIAQDEGIIVRDTQTISVDMSMSHAIVIEEFKQEKAFVVEIRILFLCEYLLTAVTFFITIILRILIVLSSRRRSIEHVNNRCLSKVNERDIVEHGMSLRIDDKYLLIDTWKELFLLIFSAVLQELHELCLIDYVQECYLFCLFGWDFLRHFDHDFFIKCRDLVKFSRQGLTDLLDLTHVLALLGVLVEEVDDVIRR